MGNSRRMRPPPWFWIVSILLVLWGLMGIIAFYMDVTMSKATLAEMSAYDRNFYATRPGWFLWVYGVAVWGGLLGAVMLLVRRSLATLFFAVSLVAVVVQFGWIFTATDLIAVKGAAATVPFPIFIAAVAIFQLWFAGLAKRNGWLR